MHHLFNLIEKGYLTQFIHRKNILTTLKQYAMSINTNTSAVSVLAINIASSRTPIHDVLRQVIEKIQEEKELSPEISLILDKWSNEATGGNRGYFMSCMKTRYHPSPQFFFGQSKPCKEQLAWLERKTGVKFSLPEAIKSSEDVQAILDCFDLLMKTVGAAGIERFVKTTDLAEEAQLNKNKPKPKGPGKAQGKSSAKSRGRPTGSKPPRVTRVAKFEMIDGKSPSATRITLTPWKNLYHGDYIRALRFVATFAGRVNTWFDAYMRAEAMVLAKVGLVHFCLQKYKVALESLPLTSLFLALAACEFGKRKAFTLEKQKQGFLNPHLERLLQLVIDTEPQGVRYIAYLIPAQEIWAKTPIEFLEEIRSIWLGWMPLISLVLEEQWKVGVWKCARRQMRVLPGDHSQKCGKCNPCKGIVDETASGYGGWYSHINRCTSTVSVKKSGVNSSLYNVAADAWQNGARFLRGLDLYLGKVARFWGKTLQLIANDQFRMGGSGAKMDPSVAIYMALTRQGVLPWRVVHPDYSANFDNSTAVRTVMKICGEQKTKSDTWIGIPRIRKGEVTVHENMICGVVVPPMSQETFKWIVSILQPFGSTEWTGK